MLGQFIMAQGKMGETIDNNRYQGQACEVSFVNIPISNEALLNEGQQLLPALAKHIPELKVVGISLKLQHDINSPGGRHITYQQYYFDIPVEFGSLKLNLDNDGNIRSIADNIINVSRWDAQTITNTNSQLSYNELLDKFEDVYNTRENFNEGHLGIFIDNGKPVNAVIIKSYNYNTNTYYKYIVDERLNLLLKQDLNRYHGNREQATGMAFFPDPLTTAQTTYGGAYIDDEDNDIAVLNVERVSVNIDVTLNAGTYILENDYLKILEFSDPVVPPVTSNTPEFNYTRAQSGFEDVNAFYHISEYKKYINSLGFIDLVDYAISVDVHALNGQDQSRFSPLTLGPRLEFGEGGVDDAEDADVIIHEYGHAISHSAAPNSNLGDERQALDEGFGDYIASSYSRSISEFSWALMFTWDGHNEFWMGRNADSPKKYPDDLITSIHSNGEIWSSALMDIWDQIGRDISDRIVIQSMYSYANNMSMVDAAYFLLQADTLLYNGQYYCSLYPILANRGFFPFLPPDNPCAQLDPSITAKAGDNDTICKGDSVQLGSPDNILPGYTYSWTPSAGLSDSTSPTPKASPNVSTVYLFRVTAPSSRFNLDNVTVTVNHCGIQVYNQLGFATGSSNLKIEIEGGETGNEHYIELTSIEGKKLIYGDHFIGNSYEINSNMMPTGVYILRIISGEAKKTEKLIKLY